MAKGIALHIGLNAVDPGHYDGWEGKLVACENDAKDMKKIAAIYGYQSTLLLTKDATSDKVLKYLSDAAKTLAPGDILFLTYSGHGGQVPDVNRDEDDGKDETWCLYDRQLVDDELYRMWAEFEPGVRILVLSDSCHSGSMIKFYFDNDLSSNKALNPNKGKGETLYRAMPPDIGIKVYLNNQNLYDGVQWPSYKGINDKISSSVLLISGCQDNQTSSDGLRNGLFTATLIGVWNKGNFKGNYPSFCKSIVSFMPPTQTPNYFTVGMKNAAFENMSPFTI